MPSEEYLNELKDRRGLFSRRDWGAFTMLPEEAPALAEVWPQVEVARRRQVLRRLLDLAEDNVEMDFDRVYMVALNDDDAEVRALSIQGLWEHEDRDAIGPLVDILRNDPSATVRAEAATALGSFVLRAEFQQLNSMDSRRIEEALQAAIDDAAESAEVAAALESGCAERRGCVGASSAYRSDNWRLRVSAVRAMGRSRSQPAPFCRMSATMRGDAIRGGDGAHRAAESVLSKPLLETTCSGAGSGIAAMGESAAGRKRAQRDRWPSGAAGRGRAAALKVGFSEDARVASAGVTCRRRRRSRERNLLCRDFWKGSGDRGGSLRSHKRRHLRTAKDARPARPRQSLPVRLRGDGRVQPEEKIG
jgi:hypothetical protein